jgi:ABC-type transport system involved in multi-copper enzyme maturation permease subunit
MTRLIRVELLKLLTVRVPVWLLGTVAGLTALFASLDASQAGRPGGTIGSLGTASGLGSVTTLTGWSMLLATVLGLTVVSGEFRHGTITLTYLAAPGRGRVLVAKMAIAACAGAAFGLAAAMIATGVGVGFAAERGYRLPLDAGTLGGHAAGAVVGAALLGAVGAGLGSMVRSQTAGVIAVLLWGLLVEPVIGGLFPSVHPYLPYTAATTLGGALIGAGPGGFRVAVRTHAIATSPASLPFVAAVALIAGVVVALGAAAAGTTLRRDVA